MSNWILEIEVQVALITSVTTLFVLLINLAKQNQNQKLQKSTQKEFEIFKTNLELEKQERERKNQYIDDEINALDLVNQNIQSFKDTLSLILQSQGDALDSSSALQKLAEARNELVSCFAKSSNTLNSGVHKIAHTAKNEALYSYHALETDLSNKRNASELSTETKEYLVEFRKSLTECQESIRDSRYSLINKNKSRRY